MTLSYLVHLANYSDGILYVLAFLFVLTMAVMFDRFWFIRRTILGGSRMVERARACTTLDHNTLADLHAQAGSLPEAPLFAAALQHAGQLQNVELAARLDEVVMLVAPVNAALDFPKSAGRKIPRLAAIELPGKGLVASASVAGRGGASVRL